VSVLGLAEVVQGRHGFFVRDRAGSIARCTAKDLDYALGVSDRNADGSADVLHGQLVEKVEEGGLHPGVRDGLHAMTRASAKVVNGIPSLVITAFIPVVMEGQPRAVIKLDDNDLFESERRCRVQESSSPCADQAQANVHAGCFCFLCMARFKGLGQKLKGKRNWARLAMKRNLRVIG
jgi:hypothetical protein